MSYQAQPAELSSHGPALPTEVERLRADINDLKTVAEQHLRDNRQLKDEVKGLRAEILRLQVRNLLMVSNFVPRKLSSIILHHACITCLNSFEATRSSNVTA